MRYLANLLGFLAFVIIFSVAVAGCTTGPTSPPVEYPTASVERPTAGDRAAQRLADGACDTWRARLVNRPTEVGDGFQIRCF